MQCNYPKKAFPWDNACIESFHSLIKREYLNHFRIPTTHAYILIFEYTDNIESVVFHRDLDGYPIRQKDYTQNTISHKTTDGVPQQIYDVHCVDHLKSSVQQVIFGFLFGFVHLSWYAQPRFCFTVF